MIVRKQVSAIERLKSLPEVFRGTDLTVRFQWTSKAASQYLYNWKRRGLVDALGSHSDVFVNLMTSPHPPWEKVMLMAMPSAVVVGLETMRQAGWITQVPHRADVAVNNDQPVYSVDRYNIAARPPGWFKTVRPGIAEGVGGTMAMLKPAWTLADLLKQSAWGDFGPWPDDVEW